MPQIRPGMAVPQMSSMQKPLVSPQQNFPTMSLPNPQQMQGSLSQPPIQQMPGPHQVPQSGGLNSFGQSALSLQMPNQPFMPHNAPSRAPLQPPLGTQQQFPQLQQQQQVPQLMLQQQQQALQSSFQSSQQAIMQLQQQIQMMQQQATQGGKQQVWKSIIFSLLSQFPTPRCYLFANYCKSTMEDWNLSFH
jgi:hypothetical protein